MNINTDRAMKCERVLTYQQSEQGLAQGRHLVGVGRERLTRFPNTRPIPYL